MGLLWLGGIRLLLLLLLLGVLGGAAREPHSLRYFHTMVSDPGPGLPQFVAVGSVDGEVFVYYDSETRRKEPRVDWIVAHTDHQYWDRETETSWGSEQIFRVGLDTLRERYNQSRGSHTLQRVYGCDLLEDGSIRGFDQYGYEGTDFLAFDKDTLTYTAADAGAQITKRKWEEEGTFAERCKNYLENTCIEWLRKYVSYGKDVLERRERPEVRVSGMEAEKILTLSCRAHGFYPRPISISWLKDGMIQEQETQETQSVGSTVPNSDGTYHAWATIDVLPGDRDKYQCRVEHASLPQPGLFSWEPQSNLIPIVVVVAVAVVAVIAALAGFAVWKSKQGKKWKGYNVAPDSVGGSNSSITVLSLSLLQPAGPRSTRCPVTSREYGLLIGRRAGEPPIVSRYDAGDAGRLRAPAAARGPAEPWDRDGPGPWASSWGCCWGSWVEQRAVSVSGARPSRHWDPPRFPSRPLPLSEPSGFGLPLMLPLSAPHVPAKPHSLRYFYTAVSDPSLGVPQFVTVGSVDGEVFVYYDSETKRKEPRVDWIWANMDQQYWDRETEISRDNEQFFRVNLDTLRERYNQSRGSHTWQVMFGCDFLEDGSITGFQQHGYNGKDFLTFDKDTLTYTAADAVAQITKRKWEENGPFLEGRKFYLENTCVEWLRKYVSYGKDVLERRERPEVRVSGMEANKILTLSCRAHGFYPRPISISWLKDGVVQEQETQRGSTVPNSDGTYHAWATIDVLPGDRDKYQCRVEHASLPQPGLFSWEPQSNLIPIVVVVAVAVVAVITALAGFAVWKSKQGNVPGRVRQRGKKEKGYNVAPGSNGGSNSSNAGSKPSVYWLCFSP
ncbi:uncharacterized protein [Anas acuta]|uniref:uncharacterized protein n=1 Tax=Anas acuta TaxID=28680 RepID=UPI0035C8FF38